MFRSQTKDESRRSRKHQTITPTTSLQASHQNVGMPNTSNYHTNSMSRLHEPNEEYTYAVYTFGDEKIPYRTKIPHRRPTLKHFKEYLPKKGNFR